VEKIGENKIGGLVVWWFDVMNKINVHVYEDWTKFQNIL
jgi:hypothetical protein